MRRLKPNDFSRLLFVLYERLKFTYQLNNYKEITKVHPISLLIILRYPLLCF